MGLCPELTLGLTAGCVLRSTWADSVSRVVGGVNGGRAGLD